MRIWRICHWKIMVNNTSDFIAIISGLRTTPRKFHESICTLATCLSRSKKECFIVSWNIAMCFGGVTCYVLLFRTCSCMWECVLLAYPVAIACLKQSSPKRHGTSRSLMLRTEASNHTRESSKLFTRLCRINIRPRGINRLCWRITVRLFWS